MTRRLLVLMGVALAASLASPGAAPAKGIGGAAAPGGVTVSGSPYRYTALSPQGDGPSLTILTQTDRSNGEVGNWWHLRGRYQLPPLTYNGSAGGVSADGSTVVLSRFSWIYPPRTSGLAIIDARPHLRQPRRMDQSHSPQDITKLKLPGSFSFDAISPDGSTIYLIQHLSPYVDGAYRVRALDTKSGALLPKPIVDPAEPNERMTGVPLDRATSPGGRWAYTLYGGKGHEPFVHALDTVGRRAACIDLPQLAGNRRPFDLALRMEEEGSSLIVFSRRPTPTLPSERLLAIDTQSFEVGEPGGSTSSSGLAWPGIAIALAVLGCGAVWMAARRRRAARGGRPEGT